MVAVVLGVAGVALAFTQLGFVSFTEPGGNTGYVVVLLQLVALSALLLGTLAGTIMGAAIGAVLLLHAQVLPLDHYELTYVTPATSVVMLGFSGFMLGVLFAFVLRNNPSQLRRAIYIAIVCGVVSAMYTVGFTSVVITQIMLAVFSINNAANLDVFAVQQQARSMAMGLGDIGVQRRMTALLMLVLCIAGDYLARRVQAYQGVLGLRTVFGGWLGVVVVLSFLIMSAVSFGVSTGDALHDAEDVMRGQISYLSAQVHRADKRTELMSRIWEKPGADAEKLTEDDHAKLTEYFESGEVLKGLTPKEYGTIIMAVSDSVYESNDELYTAGVALDEVFSSSTLDAIDRSMESGQMQRFVYYNPRDLEKLAEGDYSAADAPETQPSIAYLIAEDVPIDYTEEGGKTYTLDQSMIMIKTSDQVFEKRQSVMTWMTASQLVLMLCVFAIVFQLLNRFVGRRIDETNAALDRVTAGDLEARVPDQDTFEFASLETGINTTVDTLKGWIAEAESRMDAELQTARAIQESALPRIFPPFPDILRFDIYASMEAAKQVGGDFYDFFLIGDDCDSNGGKLGFVIADVSGKGVPAALFMMKAKALIRDYVGSGMELGEAVTEANRQLVEGNDAGMFVTAWIGVLDYATYHVDYVNAGHNPPLLWNRGEGWQWMRQKSGPVLGLFEMPYRSHSVDCTPGDTFLLYTDGVTEAFDVNEALYGEKRLLAVAEEGYRMHPRELLEAVRADVAAHAAGAEQSDDITILALEVGVPPEITATLEVPADVEQLGKVNDFLHSELNRRLCPQRVQNQLDIAVEELFVNVCHYAYRDAPAGTEGKVLVQRTFNADPPSIVVDIIDEGAPFDPLAKPDAVTPDNIEDVPIGGLGILMAKKCTDDMRYERVDGTNVVSILKKW